MTVSYFRGSSGLASQMQAGPLEIIFNIQKKRNRTFLQGNEIGQVIKEQVGLK